MSLAVVETRSLLGMQAVPVMVEVHIANGLPGFAIVGLPETSVKEAKERVRSAIINSGFTFPNKKIIVNLAPADLPKAGGRFDLPIALGILAATGELPQSSLQGRVFVGELALSGALRSVPGAVAVSLACRDQQLAVFLANEDAQQGAKVQGAEVYAFPSLQALSAALNGQQALSLSTPVASTPTLTDCLLDMSEVQGQVQAKRALELCAAGAHNLLMLGPPGTGKTMLASRLPGILPSLSEQQAIEVAAVASVSGKPRGEGQWYTPPFRSPHHSASMAALVGGGSIPKPGEISQAHHGVLFLDELPEFSRSVLDALRQPLEAGEVHISRSALQVTFPAAFQLIAAMNPSPCGYYHAGQMRSNADQVLKYLQRLSGPLLDRFDLSIEVSPLPQGALTQAEQSESSSAIRQRVAQARQRQLSRAGKLNRALTGKELQRDATLATGDAAFLESSVARLGLSARAFHRIWRLARTIADLKSVPQVERSHLIEALGYRAMERLMGQLHH